MDIGYTYCASSAPTRVSIYAPPGIEPPETVPFTDEHGASVTFMRLSDRPLECGTVPGITGRCDNYECHRRRLGECDCGRHPGTVRMEKAS